MTISEQLNILQGELSAFAKTNGGGDCLICSNLLHVWGGLMNGPAGLRILLMYNGENPRETFEGGSITGRVDRRFLIVVSRARGIALNRGDTLTLPNPQGDPLLDLVEGVRDICRAIEFDANWCERPTEYKGITPFNTEGSGIITDALQVEISVGTQLGTLQNTPTDYVAPI